MTAAGEERMVLARIGFYLCREGLVDEAERLFRGLADSAPERDGPAAGLALCLIVKGEPDAALALLDRHLAKGAACPIPGQLKLYKVLALGMGGRFREAEAVRGEMVSGGFAELAGTADALIEELRRVKAV